MNNFKKISLIILFALAIGNVPTFFQSARAEVLYHYAIQLNQPSEKILQAYGENIEHQFVFSQNPEFRNIYSFDSVLPLGSLQQKLQGLFTYLSPVQMLHTSAISINDPGFTNDYQNIDKQWGLVKAGFVNAWDETIGSSSTTVAVIDTGVDFTHEDLQAVGLADGYDFVNKMNITGRFNSDDNGHGTLVAGVLAASANNGIGIAGANWHVTVMPIKALDNAGKGDSATISQAIVWAADHGANIINLSMGGIGFDHDTTLSNAISYAFNKGVIIVAAGGNDVAKTGGDLDINPVFPICDDNGQNMIIGVTATDQNDLKATFANYGKNCIDVAAPGKRILSTINHDPVTQLPSPNSYAFASGTSLAVPFVSGEAALILSLYPHLTSTQVRDRIIRTTDPIDSINTSQCGGASCAGKIGSGRINVKKALDLAADMPGIQDSDLVKSAATGIIYFITGGQKRPVSAFVQNQRFTGQTVKNVAESDLAPFPMGPYAMPLDGTLVKGINDGTVYIISQGLKLPVTYQVFVQRKYSFANVNTISFSEMSSWITGNLLAPTDGTLVRGVKNRTVYWVVGQVLHLVNKNFYLEKGLQIFPVLLVSDRDIASFPKGEAYIR